MHFSERIPVVTRAYLYMLQETWLRIPTGMNGLKVRSPAITQLQVLQSKKA